MKLGRRSFLKHIADTGQMAVGAMLLERISQAAPSPLHRKACGVLVLMGASE
jgi:hypothetical protein